MKSKKVLITGIQSTNSSLTLGNYIGCVKQLVEFKKNDLDMYIMVADMHSITVSDFDYKNLYSYKKNLICSYIAFGIDINKYKVFFQSDVPQHTELGWVLTCHTTLGELNRMTQFKDKSVKFSKNGTEYIPTGLLVYPPLMAADILLYNADFVPIGIDQKQHLELTRNIANRFNKKYGPTFKIPEPYIADNFEKICDLQEPTKKMSKSASNPKGVIFLLDDVEVSCNKIKIALTDNFNTIKHDYEKQPGISNLINIYSALTNKSIEDIEKKYKNIKNYGEFKNDLIVIMRDFLTKFQDNYKKAIKLFDSKYKLILNKNALLCQKVAQKTLDDVYKKIGLR